MFSVFICFILRLKYVYMLEEEFCGNTEGAGLSMAAMLIGWNFLRCILMLILMAFARL